MLAERLNIDTAKWQERYGKDAIALAGGNFYRPGKGYLTDHIPAFLRRDSAAHWNAQYDQAKEFELAWKPRSGPLELIHNLSTQKPKKPFTVLNMGGGTGDFTVDLARIPGVNVVHVDFSSTANQIAQRKIDMLGLAGNTSVITATNRDFLSRYASHGKEVDFVFFYGSIGENVAEEQDVRDTLQSGFHAVKDDGHVYYVALVQPYITNPHDLRVTDILGEYPSRVDLVKEFVAQNDSLTLVAEDTSERPDLHPLLPGEESVPHLHMAQRVLIAKNGIPSDTPPFSFKAALDPDWERKWERLTRAANH